MNRKEKHYFKAFFQLFLLFSLTFSMSYFLNEAERGLIPVIEQPKKNIVISAIYYIMTNWVFDDDNFVSAEATVTPDDLSKGAYTCLQSKTGKICQEFPAGQCASQCDGVCVPSPRKDVAECKAGTCFDPVEGTCQTGSPKSTCEPNGGKWFDDPFGNIPQCKRGCCVIGGEQTFFATSQECTRKSAVLGIGKEFKPEITTELACLVLAKSHEEGACVYDFEFERTCKFGTKYSCLEKGGEFNAGYLCSNAELKTNCKPQQRSACVDGKDEVYWYDSCGNPENIYDANKVKSFNSGKILGKNESCSIGTSTNPLGNQNNCGSCNYLVGSICGKKTDKEKLADSSQEFVCRDLSCVDGNGQKRLNGESWCAYQGSIGTEIASGGFLRSTDTPGSRHFRKVCLDGEVRIEACADYRNEICVEEKNSIPAGKTFSSAACRINRWQQCFEYNTREDEKTGKKLGKADVNELCNQNPDCFVKTVDLRSGKGNTFKFNLCAPKYPAGFDLSTQAKGSGAQQVCSLANQKCVAVKVKKISGWKWVSNENCVKGEFAQQMNDLCMSLGDCGSSANYAGVVTENYKVTSSPKLAAAYITRLKTLSNPVKGKTAAVGNLTQIYGELGIPGTLGAAGKVDDPTKALESLGMISGIGGIALFYAANAGYLGSIPVISALATPAVPATSTTAAIGPSLSALGGALAGAAIGFAVVALLIQFTGIGPGLDPIMAYGLMATGAVSGAIIGANVASGAGLTGVGSQIGILAALGPAALIAFIVVIIIIIVFAILGIGKVKKTTVTFTCNPWQPPTGGSQCAQCGKDTLSDGSLAPCSKYSCQALGQTCEFINEGTDQEACIDNNPNDVSAPIMKPLQGVLTKEYSYTDVNDNGFKIKSSEECLKAQSPFVFGIQLNEPAQCRLDVQHTEKFEDMEFDFGSNLYTINHTMPFMVPSLESLGLPSYDPNKRAEYNLYVRCQDKNGNANVREHTINFCIKPGDDITAPIIGPHNPSSEVLAYNATEQRVEVFVNEPSECKWDKTDRDYDSMTNKFNCATGLDDLEQYGWACNSTFPVSEEQTKFYVRCQDQPWLVEASDGNPAHIVVEDGPDEDDQTVGNSVDSEAEVSTTRNVTVDSSKKRNKNAQSYVITYSRSRTNLKIDYIKPNNETITAGVEPVSVAVEVKTSGGVDGKAKCYYGYDNALIEFYETLGTIHKQTFQSFTAGEKELPVFCQDAAGNTAAMTSRFGINIDTSVPKVTRIYDQSGTLTVVTDEEAECSYITGITKKGSNSCNFEFSNGTIMNGADMIHTTSFTPSLTHFVKCKDNFGNTPGSCSIIVAGSEFG